MASEAAARYPPRTAWAWQSLGVHRRGHRLHRKRASARNPAGSCSSSDPTVSRALLRDWMTMPRRCAAPRWVPPCPESSRLVSCRWVLVSVIVGGGGDRAMLGAAAPSGARANTASRSKLPGFRAHCVPVQNTVVASLDRGTSGGNEHRSCPRKHRLARIDPALTRRDPAPGVSAIRSDLG
jgi:hypothetical protein